LRRDAVLSSVGVAGALFAVASALVFGMAIGFDPQAGTELVDRIVSAAPDDASFIKWGAIADLLGYYLIPAAVIVMVRTRLQGTSSRMRDLSTTAGLMYATIGAIGAAALAAAGPPLLESGDLSARQNLFTLVTIVEGLWQWLEPIPFIVWVTGVALALRSTHKAFAGLFAVLAVGGVLVWFGQVFEIDLVLTAGLILWLAPFPIALATVGWWSR
jgi:hypothetical protein